jgi:hypothetical protein
MDEVRQVRLEVMRDPSVGVVSLSRLHCERARLTGELARIACLRAEIIQAESALARDRARAVRNSRPAPRYFSRLFPEGT